MSTTRVQIELPNRLIPSGATRDLAALKLAGERGKAIVETQSYEVLDMIESGDKVAVHAIFRATLNMDVLGLPKGQEMVAHFAMFVELRDGRITGHYSYDCFEPW
ncbi:MAG TPA: nuclear transport factor 2 family protein [Methyloceanibacter sp.]